MYLLGLLPRVPHSICTFLFYLDLNLPHKTWVFISWFRLYFLGDQETAEETQTMGSKRQVHTAISCSHGRGIWIYKSRSPILKDCLTVSSFLLGNNECLGNSSSRSELTFWTQWVILPSSKLIKRKELSQDIQRQRSQPWAVIEEGFFPKMVRYRYR